MSQTTHLDNGIAVTTGAGPEAAGTRMKFVEVCFDRGYYRALVDIGNFDGFHGEVVAAMAKPVVGYPELYLQARTWLEKHGFEYRG